MKSRRIFITWLSFLFLWNHCCLFGKLKKGKILLLNTKTIFSCVCPFWGVKHFWPQTALTLQTLPTYRSFPFSSSSKTLTSVTISSTKGCQWNNLSWCNAGQRRKREGGSPIRPRPCCFACFATAPAFTLLFLSTAQRPLNPKRLRQLRPLSLSPSDPHTCLTSDVPLVSDHCVVTGLAGYMGQSLTAWRGAGWRHWGRGPSISGWE